MRWRCSEGMELTKGWKEACVYPLKRMRRGSLHWLPCCCSLLFPFKWFVGFGEFFIYSFFFSFFFFHQQGLFEPAEDPRMNRTAKQAVHSWFKMIIGLTWGNSSLVILFCQLYHFMLTQFDLSKKKNTPWGTERKDSLWNRQHVLIAKRQSSLIASDSHSDA